MREVSHVCDLLGFIELIAMLKSQSVKKLRF